MKILSITGATKYCTRFFIPMSMLWFKCYISFRSSDLCLMKWFLHTKACSYFGSWESIYAQFMPDLSITVWYIMILVLRCSMILWYIPNWHGPGCTWPTRYNWNIKKCRLQVSSATKYWYTMKPPATKEITGRKNVLIFGLSKNHG